MCRPLNWPKKQGSSWVRVIHRLVPRDQRFLGTSLTGVALSPRITIPPAKVEATGAVHDPAAVDEKEAGCFAGDRESNARSFRKRQPKEHLEQCRFEA